MTLVEWARLVCAELELSEEVDRKDVDRVLDLARDAAHSVARPAAPLTTYLLGIAVGRGADPETAARALSRLAQTWSEGTDK
ncbi:molybdopterin-guanine dinucleotide biosynthesis protein [Thermobifida halotolerans]|uniref:Molybdopterin-guanine dinucleotide biosynthesis protein n=1 Tax=Thermobifida halotolerans TaxID=483545 RepID=A0A399G1I6_9ACTN|nr:DUF6457 domain-containing protein [Thermobifida halotolerans]UOE17977.1 molybdopterin-guanine dinucleotide biosynthesis protein [Thermobifida halotolerans]